MASLIKRRNKMSIILAECVPSLSLNNINDIIDILSNDLNVKFYGENCFYQSNGGIASANQIWTLFDDKSGKLYSFIIKDSKYTIVVSAADKVNLNVPGSFISIESFIEQTQHNEIFKPLIRKIIFNIGCFKGLIFSNDISRWSISQKIGIGVANTKSISKLELYRI